MPTKFDIIRFIKQIQTAITADELQIEKVNSTLTEFTIEIYGANIGKKTCKWCPFDHIKVQLTRDTTLGKTLLSITEQRLGSTGWSVSVTNHVEHTEISSVLNEIFDFLYVAELNKALIKMIPAEPVLS